MVVDEDDEVEVEVEDDDDDVEVEDDDVLDVVVGRVLVVATTVDVLVVDVEVVVVFFLLALEAAVPHAQPTQGSPSAHGAEVSHCSPPAASSRPSPQMDAGAVKCRRPVPRAMKEPTMVVHAGSSTFALIRTPRSVSHAAKRTRTVVRSPRRLTRARAVQPSEIVASPAESMTIAPNGAEVSGTSAGSTRKRTPGQGGDDTAGAGAGAATSASTSMTA